MFVLLPKGTDMYLKKREIDNKRRIRKMKKIEKQR
jgi:hypothetical protein